MILTPVQVGQLAKHVDQAIRENRGPKYRTEKVPGGSVNILIQDPWEAALRVLVDQDPALPNYNELLLQEPLEFLIEYYS